MTWLVGDTHSLTRINITEDALKLTQTYGLGMFMAVMILFLTFFLIRYILKSGDKREERLGNIITKDLTTMTAAIQTITGTLQNIVQAQAANQQLAQTRYDSLVEANRYQRQEHSDMKTKLEEIHKDVLGGLPGRENVIPTGN